MANIIQYSLQTFRAHLPLILLFSLSFIIAFLIPVFASFPTFSDAGAIFLRSASVVYNLNELTAAVIVFSTLFSLLFLSFAIVAINVIVKHSRTSTRIRKEVMDGLEKYTSRVFVVLLAFTVLVFAIDIAVYSLGITPALAAVIGLVITPLFFYAPSSIVIDDKGIVRAIKASTAYFFKRLDYVALWLVLAIVLLTVFDFIFIAATGTVASRYVALFVNSIFILPFLVVLQSQAYMRRFSLLKR